MTPAYDVEALVTLICPVTAKSRWLAVLGAYFDASGTHAGSLSVSVAGFIAKAEQWKKFERRWREILVNGGSIDKQGRPVFHMTDFESRLGIYKYWTKKQKRYLFPRLVNALACRVRIAVAASVPVKDYEAVQAELNAFKGLGPFTFCATQCFLNLEHCMKQMRIDEPVAYIFESGDECGGELDRLKRHIEQREDLIKRFHWASFTTAVKHDFGALQGADLFAYENYKEMVNFIVPQQAERDLRKSVIKLVRTLVDNDVVVSGGEVDRESLRELAPTYDSLDLSPS